MNCKYFNTCGGCSLPINDYEKQFSVKVEKQIDNFKELYKNSFDTIKSKDIHFRNRAEFRIWKVFEDNQKFTLHYAMNDTNKDILPIDECLIVSKDIYQLMPKLLKYLENDDILNFKLFSIEFLNSTTSDMLVTLIYHKKLDDIWKEKAKKLEAHFNIKIIGRSRKQKIVLSQEFINEKLSISNIPFNFRYQEGGFTQPNQGVNIQMIEWVLNNIDAKDDLCELYCGGGNFTIPLSRKFTNVLATEISKTSIKSAKINCELNNISNIKFLRMSSQEFVEAKENVREFRRLKQENIDLNSYNFSTIFVDPPRAGLDDTTRKLVKDFEQIIYISCNPKTLKRDLQELTKTHTIKKFALFDQFVYSNHIESGVVLIKIKVQ